MDLARAVRGDDHHGRRARPDRTQLGYGDLEIREHLEEVGLKGLVAAVDFVDEEHGRDASRGVQRLKQGAPDEEVLSKDVAFGCGQGPAPRARGTRTRGVARTGSRVSAAPWLRPAAHPRATPRDCAAPRLKAPPELRGPDMDHLLREVPLVRGGRHVQPLVALEPDERPAQRNRRRSGHLRLAHAGFAFQEERSAQFQGEEESGAQACVGDVALAAQQRHGVVNRPG